MTWPLKVKIVEVGPRDGLQNETVNVPTSTKVELINRLSNTGLTTIEATSFVSPKWIPQLADGEEVLKQINKNRAVRYPVLVPNLQGLERAIAAGATDIAVFATPSEQFSQKNTNCSVAESMERIKTVIEIAKQHRLHIRGYLSCVLGCPYEGEMAPEKVARLAQQLLTMGCEEVSLGDTIGIGTPRNTQRLIEVVGKVVPLKYLAVHFHDTYGQALANIFAALQLGVSTIDSSIAGLGGCPYAKGASGNIATEDVVYMLNGMGIATGVDLKKLVEVGRWISDQLHKKSQSKVSLALTSE